MKNRLFTAPSRCLAPSDVGYSASVKRPYARSVGNFIRIHDINPAAQIPSF